MASIDSAVAAPSNDEPVVHPLIMQVRLVRTVLEEKWQLLTPMQRVLVRELLETSRRARNIEIDIAGMEGRLKISKCAFEVMLAEIEAALEYLPRP